jgi:hypothetical protein
MRRRVALEPHVDIFPVDGPGFLTIGTDHRIWSGEPFMTSNQDGIDFVRLRPPVGTPDAKVEEIRSFFEKFGKDVQVLARPRAQVVLEQAETLYEDKGIRETVETMTKEANSKDHAALEALVQRTLTEVAL